MRSSPDSTRQLAMTLSETDKQLLTEAAKIIEQSLMTGSCLMVRRHGQSKDEWKAFRFGSEADFNEVKDEPLLRSGNVEITCCMAGAVQILTNADNFCTGSWLQAKDDDANPSLDWEGDGEITENMFDDLKERLAEAGSTLSNPNFTVCGEGAIYVSAALKGATAAEAQGAVDLVTTYIPVYGKDRRITLNEGTKYERSVRVDEFQSIPNMNDGTNDVGLVKDLIAEARTSCGPKGCGPR